MQENLLKDLNASFTKNILSVLNIVLVSEITDDEITDLCEKYCLDLKEIWREFHLHGLERDVFFGLCSNLTLYFGEMSDDND